MWTAKIGLLGLVALAAGCGASPPPAEPAPKQTADTPTGAVRVEVDNENYSDMNIYLVNAGTPVLLGYAPGLAKTTLSLPPGTLGSRWQVRLLADPIGGSPAIRTPSLQVAPGQNVYWTIGSDPASSFASAG